MKGVKTYEEPEVVGLPSVTHVRDLENYLGKVRSAGRGNKLIQGTYATYVQIEKR